MLLLLIPFGFVPSNELSPLLIIVMGKPLAKWLIPESDQPAVRRLA